MPRGRRLWRTLPALLATTLLLVPVAAKAGAGPNRLAVDPRLGDGHRFDTWTGDQVGLAPKRSPRPTSTATAT
jgi:hypothetical protein